MTTISRKLVLTVAWLVTGCDGSGARAGTRGVVAHFGDHALSVNRLAELLVLGQPLPLTEDVAAGFARQWVELSAIAARAAGGDSLLDPESVARSTWFEVQQARIAAMNPAPISGVAPAALDSIYADGEWRMLAHIVKAVPSGSSAAYREQQRDAAGQILQQVLDGGSWQDAVAQSDDVNSRAQNGSLGLVIRGQTVPAFERVAFALRPGEISPVTETGFGFHIIYRPRLQDVRPIFSQLVAAELGARRESLADAALLSGAAIEMTPEGYLVARRLVADPFHVDEPQSVVARYGGKDFTSEDFARYASRLSPQTRGEIKRAPDRDIVDFVHDLIVQELRAAEADSAGANVPDATMDEISGSYGAALARLWRDARLWPDSLLAAGNTPADRAAEGARRVDQYLEAAVARRVELHSLPTGLTAWLLREADWGLDEAGVFGAIDRASRLLAATQAPND